MKQAFSITKTVLCILAFQLAFISSSFAGDPPSNPSRPNWKGWSTMGISADGNPCIVPYYIADDEYHFWVSVVIFAGRQVLENELYLYYSLPNGEADIKPIPELWEIDETAREEYGVYEEEFQYFWIEAFDVCLPACDANFCGAFTHQLMSDYYAPYPVNDPNPPAQGPLFPAQHCQYDEDGNAIAWTEYKEICCPHNSISGPSPSPSDPCQGLNGYAEQYLPDPYYTQHLNPCYNQEELVVPHDLGLEPNALNPHSLSQKIEEAVIFPNPAQEIANVQYQSSGEGKTVFEWMDTNGRVIERKEIVNYLNGPHTEAFSTQTWAPGIYFLKVSSPEGNQTLRLVKSAD